MRLAKLVLVPAVAAPAVVGCSLFGPSIDFDALTKRIAQELSAEYVKFGVKVDAVDCDESQRRPKPGSRFTCDARVREVSVPVEVTVKDDDMRVDFVTLQKLFDLGSAGPALAARVSEQVKAQVAVDCGTGLRALPPGSTFRCTARDQAGTAATLVYTVGPMRGEDRWVIKP
ncbi:hypothetical protein TPAU25S_01754 [Tsukamurella paurometabola]|uniref:DUF4333 domain-containing protein n=1 Tax=Tsukamurella paurometabola (strain ATCC 8368 / DSM 20162 / CCUG 35730 / CIP 100753 / JCM 10117 / KCTC 9821 / NBRC 16120 / NCIMB 702349 / NCTC 13040) TaxID=521096 RepID=D5UNW2_TSUPD|nr:DUF4333 domain-containing protein [Tsukamurella paurometabola]ADG78680.1 conserved hypothetical protein [Tsukamurella paurometabola DSM 20162]SUP32706.1 Uncharacterised protein [Tsukamurella paurometabola]